MDTRRLGTFRIARKVIEDNPDAVLEVMRQLIVVRCEMMWDSDALCYVAISESFDVVPHGQIAPAYDVLMHAGGIVEFVRKES